MMCLAFEESAAHFALANSMCRRLFLAAGVNILWQPVDHFSQIHRLHRG
jgi:hypothetical protein